VAWGGTLTLTVLIKPQTVNVCSVCGQAWMRRRMLSPVQWHFTRTLSRFCASEVTPFCDIIIHHLGCFSFLVVCCLRPCPWSSGIWHILPNYRPLTARCCYALCTCRSIALAAGNLKVAVVPSNLLL